MHLKMHLFCFEPGKAPFLMFPTDMHLREGWRYQIGWICGGGGVIFNPKNYIADFGPLQGLFSDIVRKKLQYSFPKMREGESKAVWNFSENSSDLVAPPFPSLTMQNCIKFIHVDGVWKRTIVLFNWVWLEWEIVMQKSESDAKYSDSNSGSDCYAYLMAMALARHL